MNLRRSYSIHLLYLSESLTVFTRRLVPHSYIFQMQRRERSKSIGNRVIYHESDVDVIEEDLEEVYPIFKWASQLEMIWVLLLLLKRARMDQSSIIAIMEYLVSSVENSQTREALFLLSKSPLGKLMRLPSAGMINKNRHWCPRSQKWLEFCDGEERRKAISLGKAVVQTACQLHTILRKTMAQVVDDMPQEDAKKVVIVAIKEAHKLRCKYRSWERKSRPLVGLIDPVIKRLNRLKNSANRQADDLRRQLSNTGIDLQDVVGVNAVWNWQSDQRKKKINEG